MPRNKRLHFKDIPALKALAFFPIYLFCMLYLISAVQSGPIGEMQGLVGKLAINSLDFFFFLSAFLITSHGLREYKYVDRFSFKNYLIRRILRISVVLIVALVFAFALHPWLIRVLALQPITTPSIEPYLLGAPNYFSIVLDDQLLYLKVISSIYMFLQFYLVWGIVLKFFRNYIYLISLCVIILGIVVRIIHFANDSSFLLDTLAYGTPIGIGALTAISIREENSFVTRLKELSKNLNSLIYIVGTIILIGGYIVFSNSYSAALVPVFTGLFFGYIIIEQTFGKNSFIQLKSKKILSYLGKISYGMIVYQAIIGVLLMIAVESLDFDLSSFYVVGLIILTGLVGSIVLADISYKLLEKPLLRIRREFKKI